MVLSQLPPLRSHCINHKTHRIQNNHVIQTEETKIKTSAYVCIPKGPRYSTLQFVSTTACIMPSRHMPAAPVTLFPFFAASIPAAYILLDSGSVDVDSNPPSNIVDNRATNIADTGQERSTFIFVIFVALYHM